MSSAPKLNVVDTGSLRSGGSDASLTDRACRLLRSDIVEGALPAGQPLRLEFLKERYGISFSPIREALNRLQSEHLVLSTAARGFRVAPLSVPDMWDTIETRILIDSEALRRSVARATNSWEVAVVGAFHALKLTRSHPVADEGESDRPRQIDEEHRQFHASLIAGCGSEWLIELSAQLYIQTERYRRPFFRSMQLTRTASNRDVEGEHSAILDAVMSRDADLACALLSKHYRETGHTIVKAMQPLDGQAAG